ncbi:MAG: hypothetical protein Q8R79_04265, partial [Legionellaceae bacterium]|nr:hypothetical protein [Legionellaceae bacterium]
MSESAVTTKQTDYLEDSCVKRPSETPHLIVLRDTLAILMRPTNTSSARRQIANEQSTIEPFSYNPVSQQWVGIQDRPFPAKNSGVFAPFQQSGQGRLLQEYIKFGESLKTLVQLRAGLADFQILVRTGGDFIAVAYFSEHTRCMLGLIEQCLTNLTGSYSALYTFAEEQYNSLCGVHKRTDQENIWMGNYQHLKALLANSPLEEIGTNLLDQIEKIHAILKSWKKNPQQNIERFQAARQNFTALLIKLNTSMSISNPTDSDKYLSWTTVLTAEPVADVSVDLILAEPDFVDDSATLSDLMLVKEILTNYAIAHKYQFNLSNIDPDIQIEGASSEKWKLALFQYKADHHKQRAEWIYDCLVTINSTDEALIKWSVLEQSIHVIESDVSQSVHFKSKNEKEGIGAQIEKIKALIQKNTAALPIPTSVQPSDIPTASKVKKPSPPTASATAPKSSLNPTVVTVPDTSAPPLTQDNPTVQNATIPAAPVNPNLVIIGQLTAWIDSAYNNPNKVEQEAFLNQFWKPLCYLEGKRFFTQTRNSALLMQYSVAQTQQTLVTQRQQFLLEVQKHSDPNTPLGAWAEEVSETLQKANASTPEAAKKQAQQKIAADAAITKQASATQQKLNLKKEDASSDLASLAWDEKTHTQLQQFMLHHKKNPLNINQVTSFLKYISECLLRKNAPKKEEVEALDKILSDILDTHSKSVAAKNDKALYLSCIVQGLISLGANPIHWMEKQMPEPTVSTTLDMTGFYIMTEQSSLIISSLILRTEHLDESSAFLQEKLSNFLRAIQTFGERLFRCVDTDDAWWYLLAKKMGIEAKGDARRQRAALFLGALKETYTILNDQLQDAIGGQTSSWKTAISYFETTAENYKKAVTASWFTNDGFKAWEALVLARDAVKKEIASIGRLRKNRELALINVQETAAKEAAQKEADLANQKTAEAEQKTTVALQEAAAATNAKTVAEADAKKAEKKSVSIVLSHLGGQISAKIATHFNVAAIQTIQGSSNKGLAFSSRLEVLIAAIETQFEIKDIDLMIKNDILSKMFADPAYTSLSALITHAQQTTMVADTPEAATATTPPKPDAPNISGVKATMYG